MIISLDCETNGLDFPMGAMPYLVTTCDDDGEIRWWEWDVDPLTRKPTIPQDDVADIAALIDAAELIYIQNAKFDARALAAIGIDLPWDKVRDTLVASHLLASNHRHDLTWLCVEYLGVDIEPYELSIKEVTRACRKIVKRDYPHWRIAREGLPEMPSVDDGSKRDEDKPWKNDMWLPRALVKAGTEKLKELTGADTWLPHDSWLKSCSAYANADSEHTLYLGVELERLIRQRGYWTIYEHRLKLPRAACEMECYGVTAIGEYTGATVLEFQTHIAESESAMVGIAAEYGHDLELAKGAVLNDNMRDFFYGSIKQTCPRCDYTKRVKHWNREEANGDVCPKCAKPSRGREGVKHSLVTSKAANLALPIKTSSKTGNATLDVNAMQEYLHTLDEGPALDFISLLADKRMYDTALSYMEAYQRYWVPVAGTPGFYRIHPSLNPCGTDHLRWSSNSPNMQNVSGESKKISNRACFGPLPDREWWRMDFKSIENRLPAYESGEPAMIELFERPKDPPFFGSYYLLNASITCPDLFWPIAEREGAFKKEQPLAYKHVKFGTLAMQYGCGERKADLLFRMRGAFKLLKDKLPLLTALQEKYLRIAEKDGYVETMPDRTVDPAHGYPILASRTDDGRVLSTTPFNYHISGTACWCKNTALVRCAEQCRLWRADGFDANVALEVHDEILFDFPRGATMDDNLPRALILKGLMEEAGENLVPSIPTPVSLEYHTESWANGVVV